jgi:hypothetical protein
MTNEQLLLQIQVILDELKAVRIENMAIIMSVKKLREDLKDIHDFSQTFGVFK